MKIEKVFEQGHQLAKRIAPVGRAVHQKDHPLWPEGFYLLSAEDLGAIAQRGAFTSDQLERRLDSEELEQTNWQPDTRYCWCLSCHASRQMMKTQETE